MKGVWYNIYKDKTNYRKVELIMARTVKNGEVIEIFSKRLYGFLVMKGFRYDRDYKHRETGKTCWVYTMTDDLSSALKEWASQKPIQH